MILLITVLILSQFQAEVREYRGNKLISCDTVIAYYRRYDGGFYISTGHVKFNGSLVNSDDKIFTVIVDRVHVWQVYVINPEHLVLTKGRITITIRGV